jgi:hypothetical protein
MVWRKNKQTKKLTNNKAEAVYALLQDSDWLVIKDNTVIEAA